MDELEEIRNQFAKFKSLHTEHIQVEKIPSDSEEICEHFYKSNPHPMWIYDLETLAFLDVNDAAVQHYGYSQEEFLSMTIKDIRPSEDIPALLENISKVTKGLDIAGTWRHIKKDGTLIHVEIISHTLTFAGRRAEIVLVMDVTERKKAEEALYESEEKYKIITENSLTGIFIHQDDRFIFVNDRFAEIHGYKTEELLGEHHLTLIHPDERETLRDIASKRLKGEIVPQRYEVRRIRKNGETIWCEMMATRISYRGRPAIMGNIIDITERKKAEVSLKERERELEIKTHNLEEANIALKVLLKRRDEDKTEIEEKMLLNIKELVIPYLEKLKKNRLDEKQEAYVGILESNLNDIISPFSHRVSSKYMNFTPTEIQIANLLRQGKTNKEIAELLNSSSRTVAFHRENIRKKLGLKNKKTNLKSYLLSLT